MTTHWPLGVCDGTGLVQVPVLGREVGLQRRARIAFKVAEWFALQTEYGQFLAERIENGHTLDLQADACRVISGGDGPVTPTNHSEHSHSIALDIRPPHNPLSDKAIVTTDMARFGRSDGVKFVNSFKRSGIAWGAGFDTTLSLTRVVFDHEGKALPEHTRVDPMHFELHMSPLEVRERDWATLLRSGGMNPRTAEAFVEEWAAPSL